MRLLVFLLSVMTLAGAAAAQPLVTAQCYLRIDGRILIDRTCKADPGDASGSFAVGVGDTTAERMPYFAHVIVSGGTGEAFWNGSPAAPNAHEPLGPVTRDGACWRNARARICAWPLTGKSTADAQANTPRQPAATGPARPVMVGGSRTLDACGMLGQVAGLGPVRPSDPKSGFLSVRSGPGGSGYVEVARLFNGEQVIICDRSGKWYGVLYKGDPETCGVNDTIAARQPYQGPCPWGWVHRSFIRETAG